MRYRCVIFDWDGTLSDSLDLIVETMKQSMLEMGLEFPGYSRCQSVIGLGLKEAMQFLYPDFNVQEIDTLVDRYRVKYRDLSEKSPDLFPGMKTMLERLHGDGYHLAVATGKSRRGLDRSLESTDVSHLFHATCCSDEALSKPHPMMVETIMRELKVENDDTIMIGDTAFDLEMANNAGIACAAVNYGAHSVEDLLKFQPEKTFNNLNDLPEWLSKPN